MLKLLNLSHNRQNRILVITLRASCGAVYCNRSCLWVCDSGRAGGRAVSEPYYSQRARSVCVSLSGFFHLVLFCSFYANYNSLLANSSSHAL